MILIAAVVVGIVGAVGLWGVSGYRPATLSVATLSTSPSRMALLSVINSNSRPFVLWQPFYVERQQDKSIVVGTGRDVGLVIHGGTSNGPSSTAVSVTLTGSDRGKWRVVASASGYGLLGQVDALVKKPQGWTLKSPVVRFVLRRFARTATSDWLEERVSTGFGAGPAEHEAFRQLLQSFQAEKGRWPTNYAEVKEFAVSNSRPAPDV